MTQVKQISHDKKPFNKKYKKDKLGIATNFADSLEGRKQLWFEEIPAYEYEQSNVELSVDELTKLNLESKKCFDAILMKKTQKTTSQDGWLKTAASKGTARDRATAGALLVESDPITHLSTLNSLIGQCKAANKECLEVIDTLTELFLNCLLPKDRKLKPISARGAEYKSLNEKSNEITSEVRSKILAYWYFEAELKDSVIGFIRNLQSGAGIGLEITKCRVISCAARLLEGCPEQEQSLLALLINKLGDPSNKVASKTIYHLKTIAHKHPNMCGVVVKEAEKLLFRNNLPRKAQHYALCFLGQLGTYINNEVAERVIRICIAFFKACVNKGEVETRTMSTILSCVRRAILKVESKEGSPVIPADLQETMFRIIYATNFKISIQALGLIMQVEQGGKSHSDKFFSALYKRLQDPQLGTVTPSTMAMCLNILYRALLADHEMPRCQAFIKRLLQISLYLPVAYACGCLIVISRILQTRKGLFSKVLQPIKQEPLEITKKESKNWLEEDEGDEVYKDVEYDFEESEIKEKSNSKNNQKNKESATSWLHVTNIVSTNFSTDNVAEVNEDENKNGDNKNEEDKKDEESKIGDIDITNIKIKKETIGYDPYHRNPLNAGANLSLNVELLKLREHFHPTVQLFADRIFSDKKIDYDGDPLVDFSCRRFLERFSFKNPKQMDTMNKVISKKKKISVGSRGRDIRLLNEHNVTEDERFIFEYLERQRDIKKPTKSEKEEDDSESDDESVNDDEFDEYLDKIAGADNDQLDYMEDVGDSLKNTGKKQKNDDDSESDEDLGDDEVGEDDDEVGEDDDMEEIDQNDMDDNETSGVGDVDNFSDLGSGDDDELLDELDDDDMSDIEFSDDENVLDEPAAKKKKGGKKKGDDDFASLFANADDFAHLLDEAGASKEKLGTSSAILNRDKSSDKQLKWEEKRRQNSKSYYGKKGKRRH